MLVGAGVLVAVLVWLGVLVGGGGLVAVLVWGGVFVGSGVSVGNGVGVGCGVLVGGSAVDVFVGGAAVLVLVCTTATACFAATGVVVGDWVAFGFANRDKMMARRTRAVIPPSVYKTIFQSLIKHPFTGFLLIYEIVEIVDNPISRRHPENKLSVCLHSLR